MTDVSTWDAGDVSSAPLSFGAPKLWKGDFGQVERRLIVPTLSRFGEERTTGKVA
jgi:hypothetical protein